MNDVISFSTLALDRMSLSVCWPIQPMSPMRSLYPEDTIFFPRHPDIRLAIRITGLLSARLHGKLREGPTWTNSKGTALLPTGLDIGANTRLLPAVPAPLWVFVTEFLIEQSSVFPRCYARKYKLFRVFGGICWEVGARDGRGVPCSTLECKTQEPVQVFK